MKTLEQKLKQLEEGIWIGPKEDLARDLTTALRALDTYPKTEKAENGMYVMTPAQKALREILGGQK